MSTSLAISGLASGFDWKTVVDQLVAVERAPQTTMRNEQTSIQQRGSAFDVIQSQLTTLQTKAKALSDPTLFDSRAATSSDTTKASATASSTTPIGTYSFNVSSLATSTILRSASDMGGSLSLSSTVDDVYLDGAAFGSAVTAGTFSVNGKQITVATTDKLSTVFANISAATGGTVTAAYDPDTDKITLTNNTGQPVVLGSANDTSNFLAIARLNNNPALTPGSSVTSSMKLGSVITSKTLDSSNLATAITDGGAHAGSFTVNGVSISYNASTDTINDVLKRITDSTAGVSASYDPLKDGFVLTNKVSGDLGLALEDVTGNFLTATGLVGSPTGVVRGSDLTYTVTDVNDSNGLPLTLKSHSNTIDEVSSGIPGLNVTALATGAFSINVSSDTTSIKQAIKDFITEYNRSQTAVDTYTASSTDSKGAVTAGPLSSERDAFDITSKLRNLANGQASGVSTTITFLSNLGIESNGTDNSLTAPTDSGLDAALSANFAQVKDFFTNSTSGFGKKFYDYLDSTVGENGDLPKKQTLMAQQISAIDDQIAAQERQVQNVQATLTAGFIAMETAQAGFTQQQQFINQKFGIA